MKYNPQTTTMSNSNISKTLLPKSSLPYRHTYGKTESAKLLSESTELGQCYK